MYKAFFSNSKIKFHTFIYSAQHRIATILILFCIICDGWLSVKFDFPHNLPQRRNARMKVIEFSWRQKKKTYTMWNVCGMCVCANLRNITSAALSLMMPLCGGGGTAPKLRLFSSHNPIYIHVLLDVCAFILAEDFFPSR